MKLALDLEKADKKYLYGIESELVKEGTRRALNNLSSDFYGRRKRGDRIVKQRELQKEIAKRRVRI